jgi:hypothetical protein
LGLLGRRPVLLGAAAFLYIRGLAWALQLELRRIFVCHALQIDLRGRLPLETEGIVIVLRPAPVICNAQSPLGAY